MNSSCVVVSPGPTEIELTYQSSPFQVTLTDADSSCKQNLESGVRVVLSALKAYWFTQLWGCEITAFHEAMTLDWKILRAQVKDGTFLSGKAVVNEPSELCFETETVKLLQPVARLSASALGQSPRSCFPLVIVLVLSDEEEEPSPTETVALICAIHVQDSLCTSDTSFVFKLSKLANGQTLNLTHLFTRETGEEAADCLICETRRVAIGLLPCRHFSICEVCYSMLESPKRCPVCRSYITRFFRHRVTLPEQQDVTGDSVVTSNSSDESGNWMSRTIRKLLP